MTRTPDEIYADIEAAVEDTADFVPDGMAFADAMRWYAVRAARQAELWGELVVAACADGQPLWVRVAVARTAGAAQDKASRLRQHLAEDAS